ncbi:phytoene desaturase family protein [Haloarculaceae archaeon H-GB1-1]|nr:phytoene desaturase family protein [Haloarculaceae archaeon H-GB1-1]
MTSTDTSVVIVGSGFGGLSTACYLADAGLDVTVVEKNEQLGGRASTLERDGFRFDMGPSWYLMPDVFERFFDHFGKRPSDYYELTHLDPHYRIFFKDGEARRASSNRAAEPRGGETPRVSSNRAVEPRDGEVPRTSGGRTTALPPNAVDVTGDVEQTKALFEAYEPGAGEAFERYLDGAREAYEVGMEHFVYEERPRFRDYADWSVVKNARGLSLLSSMQDHVAGFFDHPKLQQIMQYTLVFLGGSPANTPALYKLMSHVDFNLGVYYPQGGMGRVVDALVDLGTELGVEYHTGAPVTAIRGERGNFRVETTGSASADQNGHGRTFTADVVVSDADYAHTEQELLEPADRQYDADYWTSKTYAPSAFLTYLGVEGELDDLAHHTLVLPSDWDRHFERIFDRPAWPADPAYYLCVPSKTDDGVAPPGHANMFALVPIAPGLDDGPERRQQFRDQLLDDIAANTGVELRDRIVVEEHFSVSEFADRYNSQFGTALGLAHTLRQTGPMRPNRRSSALDGLYFTGSYTTPGIGVPMCLISGEHTADAVTADLPTVTMR